MKTNFLKNKWFIAFLVATVVAVAAAVVAIVIGVTANRPPEAPDAGGEDFIGVYYYDVEGVEIVLTFSDNKTFTIAGPGMNKTGTYIFDGSTVNLDFFKDEDGTTTATVNGDSLALIYADATMNFLKKVNYTVSFNTNGGSEVPSASVLNGKTVAQPEQPTKENNVFLGWYADEALTVPYAFNTVVVKADATVYAKWAEKTAGVPEYVVNFDLGYEGATALEAITTVSGKAHGVVTPTREGYTFGGWWISMYEDATRLSYEYSEDTVFNADTTLFAVWYDDASTKLESPKVTVTDSMITWNTVEGATGYLLSVTAPDGTTLISGEKVGATTKAYSFADKASGEYKIEVVAVAGKEENNSDPAVRYFANKILNRVSQIQVMNGILIFGGVENAEKYLITIDCANDQHVHTNFDNGRNTTYYLGNCPMQKGGILITVTAVADGYASSVSKTFVYDLSLDKIENVVYDQAKEQFAWTAVPGAAKYLVTVTIGDTSITVDNGTFTTFSVATYSGNIKVSVVPATEGYNSPDPAEATCEKKSPATPSGVTLSGNVISWNPVDGAASYEVKIGDKTATVTTNSIDMAQSSMGLLQGRYYEVQVKTITANNEASAYSKPLKFGYFLLNPQLTYNNRVVSWTPVLGINEFQVRVNGGVIFTVTDVNSTEITLPRAGENLIEVRYVYDGTESEWASVSVTAHTVEYDTRSGSGSLYEYLAVGDRLSLPSTGFSHEGYDFAGWYNAPAGAEGNGLRYADDAVFTGNAHTVLYSAWTPKTYNVELKTEGYSNNINNIEEGKKEPVVYTKDFRLPVPTLENPGVLQFAGWYTGTYGTGRQITDGTGASVAPYPFARDVTLYPYFASDVLEFRLQSDGTYAVRSGVSIDTVANLTIPVTFNDKPVTVILESGFLNCNALISVEIPDTVTLVGRGAFNNCKNLEKINIYKGQEGTYETFYESINDCLIRHDMGTVYLEVVPAGKTGAFVIPDIVQSITPRAFYYSKITSVTIPNNVTGINDYSFYLCRDLKSVIFETGRTNPLTMTGKAFASCSAIESIVLPQNMDQTLDELKALFNEMTGLRSISVEDGGAMYASVGGMLTNKEKTELLYCPKAYQGALSIPSGITTIGASAFEKCNSITEITIPIWVTTIKDLAFSNMKNVQSVLFKGGRSDNLTVGKQAFYSIAGLETLSFEGNTTGTLDAGVITFSGTQAFATYSSACKLQTVTLKAGANIAGFSTKMFEKQNKLLKVIVEKGARVGKIDGDAFADCTGLNSFTVPSTVTKIEAYAFSDCTSLSVLDFDPEGTDSLTIADNAFSGCSRLRSIMLPDRLDTFEASAFKGCDDISEIKVSPTNPKYMSDDKGILYKKDASITDDAGNPVFSELIFYPSAAIIANNGVINNLPDTLVKIGGSAFSNNEALKSITIPAGVKSIDNSAFLNCSNLAEVIFIGAQAKPGAASSLVIGQSAFENCVSLTGEFKLPSYTTSIGKLAFAGAGFSKFTVPEQVTSIGISAFYGCPNLETLDFACTGDLVIATGARTRTNGGAFMNCTALKVINLPKTLKNIPKYTFEGCSSLLTVNFGPTTSTVVDGKTVYSVDSQLVSIGNGAFGYCDSLKSVVIPNTVTAIGQYAFGMNGAPNGRVGSLESVIFEEGGTEPLHIYTYAFEYQPKLKEITFPARVSLPSNVKNGTVKDANSNQTYLPITLANTKDTTNANSIAQLFRGAYDLAAVNFEIVPGVETGYISVNGMIYDATGEVLIYCPPAHVGGMKDGQPTYELVIPKEVRLVLYGAMLDLNKVTTVTFEEYAETAEEYGTPLLRLGHKKSGAKADPVIGGVSTSITTINLPSHLADIGGYAFAISEAEPKPMAFNFNMDATNLILRQNAFRYCAAETLRVPDIGKVYNTSGTALTATNIKTTGSYLFADASLLKNVEITSIGYTSLPAYAFANSTALTTVSYPSTITAIGNYAFQNCAALTAYEIPAQITSLGTYAFKGSGLVSITIPKGITSIPSECFNNCKSLTTVNFEVDPSTGAAKLTTIDSRAFQNCTELANVNFDKLTKITKFDSSCFENCVKLTDIDFTKFTSLSTIGVKAFTGTSLVTVDLSNCTASTLNTAFVGIPTMKTFVFGKNMTSITAGSAPYYNPFTGNTGLEKVVLNSKFTVNMLFVKSGSNVNNNVGFIFRDVLNNNPNAEIVVPAEVGSGLYKDEFGVIYTDSTRQTLCWAPPTVVLDEYVIPDTVITINEFAFAYSNIKKIVVPAQLHELKAYAFYHANASEIVLTDTIDTPNLIEKIGNYAFAYSGIISFVIPDSVNTVGDYVFAYCPNLTSITTSARMTSIPDGFAEGTKSLTELNMQEGLAEINAIYCQYLDDSETGHQMKSVRIPASVNTLFSAFCGMDGLEEVIFAEDSQLTEVFAASFMNCSSLERIVLPEGVEVIDEFAFENCTSLEYADLSQTAVIQILEFTFANTPSLKEVKLPTRVNTLCDRAFYGSGLESIYLPAELVTFGLGVFENCVDLKTVTFAPDSQLKALEGTSKIYGMGGRKAAGTFNIFRGTTSLETVYLPNGLNVIGDYAFENSGIQKIEMTDTTAPSRLTTIGEHAFANCTRLASFEHMGEVVEIRTGAFMNCTALKTVELTDKLDRLGAMAFAFSGLDRGYIPANVFELGGNPYAGMTAAQIEVDKNNSMFVLNVDANGTATLSDSFGDVVYGVYGATGKYVMGDTRVDPVYAAGALAGNAITELDILRVNDTMTDIPDYFLMNCSSLATVTMESGFKTIGKYAFYNTGIEALEIPSTVTEMKDYAFTYCTKLDNLAIPGTVVKLGNYVFAYCTSLTSAEFLPAASTTTTVFIGHHLFYNCSSLKEVSLPTKIAVTAEDIANHTELFKSFTSTDVLPSYMFAGTAVTRVVLPNTIKQFNTSYVFADCDNLVEVVIETTGKSMADLHPTMFDGCDKLNGNIIFA